MEPFNSADQAEQYFQAALASGAEAMCVIQFRDAWLEVCLAWKGPLRLEIVRMPSGSREGLHGAQLRGEETLRP
jgi:hypothetical protein